MPSFEEDAFARAQQMHRRRPQNQSQSNKTSPTVNTSAKSQEVSSAEQKADTDIQTEPTVRTATAKNDSFLNVLFKDKDQSIILLLIVLLMEENSNPTLLLALIYLLI
ncbi:MAG TPA: hypothetical protein DD413_07545 [Ruminococcus sp.]|nr:hypothetical protein [Ruminococcus sp.]